MSVYVDPIRNWGWRLGPSCHMIADTPEELNAMADVIGMKRSWVQTDKNRPPHYDLTEKRRGMAVKRGAVELTSNAAFVNKMYEIGRKSGLNVPSPKDAANASD